MAEAKAGGGGQDDGAAPRAEEEEGGPAVFGYSAADFVFGGVAWGPEGEEGPPPSAFDRALRRAWEERQARGLFRYRLGALRTRVVPGALGLVAQLNPRRATERRAPQEMRALGQAFDPARFNFTQLRPAEVLFALARRDGDPEDADDPPPVARPRVLVAINASPLEAGHVLLLPEPGLGLPQVLTVEALRAGLEALLLSGHPGFRLGFNSPGAGASVNHLHLHAFYLARRLPVEAAPAQSLRPQADLYLLRDGVPAPGLLFYSPAGRPTGPLARRVCRLTAHLLGRGVAHNLFATRGAPPDGPAHVAARPGLRVLLWPRRAVFGAKDQAALCVALCELAGHLPLPTARLFETLSEAQALRLIRQSLLPEARFARLVEELAALLDAPPGPAQDAQQDPSALARPVAGNDRATAPSSRGTNLQPSAQQPGLK